MTVKISPLRKRPSREPVRRLSTPPPEMWIFVEVKTSTYLLTCHIVDGDILRLVEDGVEDLVSLQAEGGDGEQDEEE